MCGRADLDQTRFTYSLRLGRELTEAKSVLSLIPGEGVFFSSETKHDRRTPLGRRGFRNKDQIRKAVLGSVPGEDRFCR